MGVFEDFAASQARINARWDFCECGFRVAKGDKIRPHFNRKLGGITPEIQQEMMRATESRLGLAAIINPVPAHLQHMVCTYPVAEHLQLRP